MSNELRHWMRLIEGDENADNHPMIAPELIEQAEAVVADLARRYPAAGYPKIVPSDVFGDDGGLARHGGGNIYLSVVNWNAERLQQYEKEWQGLAVDPSPAGIIIHEFGHALAGKLEKKLGHDNFWPILYRWLGVGEHDNLVLSNDQCVSPYAGENIFEFVAEAFVTYDSKGRKIEAGAFSDKARRIAMGVWAEWLQA